MSIVLVPHQTEWALQFISHRSEMMRLLDGSLETLEHFGSTSIPGIAAKPIVDIIGTVAGLSSLDKILSTRLPSHVKNLGENGLAGRRYLVIHDSRGKTLAHVHLFERGDPAYANRIAFRDFLRANVETAGEYETLKKDLAARFKDAPVSYWNGKASFVEAVLHRARQTSTRQ